MAREKSLLLMFIKFFLTIIQSTYIRFVLGLSAHCAFFNGNPVINDHADCPLRYHLKHFIGGVTVLSHPAREKSPVVSHKDNRAFSLMVPKAGFEPARA